MTRKNKTLVTIVFVFLGLICAVAFFSPQRIDKYNYYAACRRNLADIDQAKRIWADKLGKSTNETPTWTDLRPYLEQEESRSWKDGLPKCPKSGNYTIGRLDELPKCSIGGLHSIP